MYRRYLQSLLRDALEDSPVVLLNGARQTGKSTLAQMLLAEREAQYFTFDNASALSAAATDPSGFLAGLPGAVVLDEVQRVPELFLALKAAVDRDRQPGRFLLTGSANVLLLPRLADSLAGRMEILELWPLSQGEIENSRKNFIDLAFGDVPPVFRQGALEPDLLERMLLGGYPGALGRSNQRRRAAWFEGYLTTILQRDIRDLANIEGLAELPRLLSLLAARSCTLLNYAELSRSSGIAQSTLKRYLSLLEASFLVRLLPAWSGNLSKRLIKSPKVLLNDVGLTAHLLGLDKNRLIHNRTLFGQLLELFVGLELFKQAGWSETRPQLFHYRDVANREVDLLLERPSGTLVGVEVKATQSIEARDFKGLRALAEETGERFHRGVVFYTGDQVVPFATNLHAVPIAGLWR